jgi:hypothetical protein
MAEVSCSLSVASTVKLPSCNGRADCGKVGPFLYALDTCLFVH